MAQTTHLYISPNSAVGQSWCVAVTPLSKAGTSVFRVLAALARKDPADELELLQALRENACDIAQPEQTKLIAKRLPDVDVSTAIRVAAVAEEDLPAIGPVIAHLVLPQAD